MFRESLCFLIFLFQMEVNELELGQIVLVLKRVHLQIGFLQQSVIAQIQYVVLL